MKRVLSSPSTRKPELLKSSVCSPTRKVWLPPMSLVTVRKRPEGPAMVGAKMPGLSRDSSVAAWPLRTVGGGSSSTSRWASAGQAGKSSPTVRMAAYHRLVVIG